MIVILLIINILNCIYFAVWWFLRPTTLLFVNKNYIYITIIDWYTVVYIVWYYVITNIYRPVHDMFTKQSHIPYSIYICIKFRNTSANFPRIKFVNSLFANVILVIILSPLIFWRLISPTIHFWCTVVNRYANNSRILHLNGPISNLSYLFTIYYTILNSYTKHCEIDKKRPKA